MDRLWYNKPADIWEEALPVGNGSIGGMIYGGVLEDRIFLNQDTLWSGTPHQSDMTKEDMNKGRDRLESIRKLILEEKYTKARELMEDHILGPWGESYLPLGDIWIETQDVSEVTGYSRELDLRRGSAGMKCKVNGVPVEREYICSYPAGGMIIHTVSDEPMNVKIRLNSKLQHTKREEVNQIIVNGRCPVHVEPDYMGDMQNAIVYGEGGIGFQARLGVVCTEGGLEANEGEIRLRGVKSYTIFITVADSFHDDQTVSNQDYAFQCRLKMQELLLHPFEWHKERHLADYCNLYGRFSFSLEGSGAGGEEYELLPTDERLRQFSADRKDVNLFALLVNYSRYLMIAASRPGSQPMNLQGIWNKNVRAVWSSNFTVNINTQMNYWPVQPVGLPELQEPLNRMLMELSEAGKITAKELYGCEGWVSHHNIDLWRKTTPAGGPWKRNGFSAVRHSMWPMSGAWLCRHLYEQYEYTLDVDFLRNTAFPVMAGSAEFLLDWLVKMPDGSLGTVPSTSPENEFLYKGEAFGASISSTMDIFLCRELFTNCMEAMDILGIDDFFYHRIKEAVCLLPQPASGEDGRLLEWGREYEEAEVNHRHVSHLYGLYPSDIMPEQLKEACRKSLIDRGDEGTGWSFAWKACLWARLGEPERVYRLFERLLGLVDNMKEVDYKNGGIYPNLFMAHPPFQIDANFGIAAAILETLVQCRNKEIFLLSALPDQWKNGQMEGVAAKNGLLLDIIWKEGVLSQVKVRKIRAGGTKETVFVYQNKKISVVLSEGEERTFSKDEFV